MRDVGFQSFATTGGWVSGTGIPVVIYGANIDSSGGGTLELYSDDGVTLVITKQSTKDAWSIDLPFGVTFKNGCHVSFPGTRLTVFYRKI